MAEQLPHLKIDSFFSTNNYVYPREVGGTNFSIRERDKVAHGSNIIKQLNGVKTQFSLNQNQELPQNITSDNVLYVEFISEWNFELKFDSFNQETNEPTFQLLSIKKELIEYGGQKKERYRVAVMMREGAISIFLKKAAEYLTEVTKDKEGNPTNTPKNNPLIANIQTIELATLRAFWSDEPEIPFPDQSEVVWWEVWFRRTNDNAKSIERVSQNLVAIGAEVGQQTLEFPEHTVKLVKASAIQLSSSLVLLDNLAELRKPQQLNDFITNPQIELKDKQTWIDDLLARTEFQVDDKSVIICLLDSGVNNKHPLLTKILPDSKLYTYKESWGTNDSWDSGGHGTGMSGLALYGDLTKAIDGVGKIQIFYGIESFKIVHPADPTHPELYGSIYEYACSTPIVDAPDNPRIYCLAITDKQLAFNGRPSSSSAVIDRISLGNSDPFIPQLFIVSSGNVTYQLPQHNSSDYPNKNHLESVHDPAQSYNALTVGTYTRMDRIDQNVYPNIFPLAANGGMSPSNSTSLIWENQWPIKPDIVMEGGNLGVNGTALQDNIHTLKPLSIDKDFTYLLYPFGDTSGAAALASKLAAELETAFPKFWPETIRAIIVHSAEWTTTMLDGIDLANANILQKRNLLRTFGYGVPIREKAFYSAQNSVTLIAENQIQPYKLEGSSDKTNEYHLYQIPWPVDVLQNLLSDLDVKLTLTLSYFIDPNPGNRRYSNNFSYYSHSLDFKMIKPTENLEEFKRRVSKNDETQDVSFQEEPWILKEALRNRGSIKKDLIVSSGADLATRNYLAIYPKKGWYRSRKRLGMINTRVRYSLIVSIETENVDANLYTPIYDQITIKLQV